MKNYDKVPPLSEWPDWANWFAVDEDGSGYLYDAKPIIGQCVWKYNGRIIKCHGDFDPTDWENSLVTREELEDREEWADLVPGVFPDLRKRWEIEYRNTAGDWVMYICTMTDLVENYLEKGYGSEVCIMQFRYREIKPEKTVEDYAQTLTESAQKDGFMLGVRWRDKNPVSYKVGRNEKL